MDWETWKELSPAERNKQRDLSGLTLQLTQWRGWRVKVVDKYGETRRFIVGMFTGWRPCHVELARRNSSSGPAVMGAPFKSVRALYKVR